MKVCFKRGIALAIIASLSACATLPESHDSQLQTPQKPFTENPGDVSFDNPTADIMYRVFVAELATQRGSPDVAAKFYVDAAKLSNNASIASRAVRIASFADDKEDALEAAKIWVNASPEDTEAKRVLAVLYLRNGLFDDAKTLLSDLLDTDKDGISRNILLTGALLQREASLEGALKVSDYLLSKHPQYAESHYVHASLAIQANKTDIALASIQKSLEIKADWADAAILYPRILQELGRNDDAIAYFTSFLENNPKADNVRLAYARTLVDTRDLENARSQFELLAVKMPNNQDVLFALAMLSMQFKDYDEAEGYLTQLERLGKSSPQVLYYLGQIAEQKEQYEASINAYSKIRSGEFFMESQLRIALILSKTKSLDDALAHLNTIPTNTDAEKREIKLFHGNLLREAKQYQQAFDHYTEMLINSQKDPDVLYFRALIAERLDKIDIVIEDLSSVIEQDPENAAAINALGYTLADKTDKLEEALKLIQRALDLEPDDPAIIDSLGWVHFRLGNQETALKYLKEAMDKIDDAEVAAHYGEALWTSGDKEQAIEVWKKAFEKNNDNDVLIETMKRFGIE